MTPLPPAPGRGFGRLWAANAVSNVGDGITLAAGPLLVASLTADPALIAGAVFVQQLPWLLFALVSGAYVDRLDRRLLAAAANGLRALTMAGLAAAVGIGEVTVPGCWAGPTASTTCSAWAGRRSGRCRAGWWPGRSASPRRSGWPWR